MNAHNTLSAEVINRFSPLDSIAPSLLDQLNQTAHISDFESGTCIIKSGVDNGLNHYLIDGELELRLSFDNRKPIVPGDINAKHCLENSIANGGMIKASSKARILSISRTAIDQLLEKTQRTTAENDKLNEKVMAITVEEEVDWSQYFIQTAFAANLNASQLHQLFTELRTIPVKKGQILVSYGASAEHFYIMKKGAALIMTDPSGYFRGKKIIINEGHFFGDEAIIANTCRNATVKMVSNGEVGVLEREAFERIIKPSLVQAFTDEVQLQRKHKKYIEIDVRFELEYQRNNNRKALHIPIGQLRGKLSSFKPEYMYIISPPNDARSRLAAYLLRQAGFEAYYMID